MSLEENLRRAQEAIEYARKIILTSSTDPTLTISALREATKKVLKGRTLALSSKTYIRLLFTTSSWLTFYNKLSVKRMQASHAGNCGEYTSLAANFLRKQSFQQVPLLIEQFYIDDGDHAFVVIGRAPNSDPNDYRTWGPNAVVCDPWANKLYPATEIPAQLRCYVFDSVRSLNTTYPFQPGINQLIAAETISIQPITCAEANEEWLKQKEKFNLLLTAVKKLETLYADLTIPSLLPNITKCLDAIKFNLESELLSPSIASSFHPFTGVQTERIIGKLFRAHLSDFFDLLYFFDEDIQRKLTHCLKLELFSRLNLPPEQSMKKAKFDRDLAIELVVSETSPLTKFLQPQELYLLACCHESVYKQVNTNAILQSKIGTDYLRALETRYSFLKTPASQSPAQFFKIPPLKILPISTTELPAMGARNELS